MKYVRYERNESGIVERKHVAVTIDRETKIRDYPHRERLVGWPERTVYWDRSTGIAIGVAPK